jgi:hypothetical protein
MLVADVFKVNLYADPLDYFNGVAPQNITSGIINVDIQFGTDIYEGPQQQIDTGQFTIVTRNPNMDPKINTNLKYNSAVHFIDERSGLFFRGFVTDVQVEYQRKNDPIITITGTDIFGAMQRVVIDQDIHDLIMANSTGPTWNGLTFSEFIYYMTAFTGKYLDFNFTVGDGPSPLGFWFDASQDWVEQNFGDLGYSPAKYIPQVGESYLEVVNKYAQTNMTSFTAIGQWGGGAINVYSFPKYDPQFWGPQQDPILAHPDYDFSSDAVDNRPYESILLDNGYNRVINQADISNEYRYIDAGELKSVTESITRASEESIDNYAISRASISTAYPEDGAISIESWADGYSKNIFQVSGFPGQEIQQITFDNARLEDIQNDFTYSNYDLNKMIRIKHEINNNQIIDRVYDIAGISHNITPDKWQMSFTLKPSKQELVFEYQGQSPTIEMNSLTGDANFNFTATITNFPTETIESITWALSATDPDEIGQIWPYALSGRMFKDGLPRTGLTQTWNFDDDGILAPYSFDTINFPPEDNRFGGYGPGNWTVYAYLKLINGFYIVVQQQLVVGTPAVEADFGWTQNLTNNFGAVQFTDTSVNHETGEPDSYLWTFGDGTTSLERNPTHVYDPAPGQTTYSVSLRVFAYGPGGTKVYNTKTRTVTLVQPTMTPNFTWIASNNTVTFTNTSTNVGFEEPDAYLWNFGDGTTSTLKNPVKTFAAAANVPTNYSVTLTTRNIWEQTADITKTVTVDSIYTSGTLPVTQIGIETSPYFQDGTTFIAYLKALRSDGANLCLNTLTSAPNQTYKDITNNATTLPGTQLTRNPATSSGVYGLKRLGGTRQGNLLLTSITQTQNINNINMLFDDKYPAATYLFTTWDRVYATANDSFGGTYPIGYWDLPAIPNYAPIQTYGREYAMTPIRPMPPKIPYFKYTFDNRTVSFTSVETADSYAWTFGDGTTSTVKNPVKTYAAKGTYNVTLAVTNGGVVTRTTTEPVIIESLIGYPVRYIKFAQKDHTGINAWDTPYINNVRPIFNRNALVQTSPVAKFYINPISIAKANTYSMDWYRGTVSPGPVAPTIIDPIGSANNTRLYDGGGLRVKSLDGTFRTKWELTGDFGTAISNIDQFRAQFSRWSNYDGTPSPVCTGISYEIYVTDYVGAPSGISGATWTKIGDFTPTSMPLNGEKDYQMVPL